MRFWVEVHDRPGTVPGSECLGDYFNGFDHNHPYLSLRPEVGGSYNSHLVVNMEADPRLLKIGRVPFIF